MIREKEGHNGVKSEKRPTERYFYIAWVRWKHVYIDTNDNFPF